MKNRFISIFGWFATGCLLYAYAMTSLGYYSATSGKVHFLNLVGATGLGLVTYSRRAFQATLVNLVWGIVALVGLTKILF